MILLLYSNRITNDREKSVLESILNEINSTDFVNKIYVIRVDKDEIRNWLINNTSNIVVNTVPCFLVKDEGGKLVIYNIYEWNYIKMISGTY